MIEPIYFVITIIIALLVGGVVECYRRQGKISKTQSVALVLLISYTFLIFALTVFSRKQNSYYRYKLILFWSYRLILKGSTRMFWQDVLNMIMLLPIGILLPMVMVENESNSKRIFRRVVLVGFLISLTIEILQLILKCGWFEFDDMFHNTIGAAIGYWIYKKMRKLKK